MTSRCVDEAALLRLLDGDVTEDEAERMRQHLRSCKVCAARSGEIERTVVELKAPVADLSLEPSIEEMMRKLPTAVADPYAVKARPAGARRGLLAAGVAAMLAVSALVVVPRVLHPTGDGEDFRARGGSVATSLARAVGVTLFRSSASTEAIAPGAHVRADEAYGVKYSNLRDEPAYLLAFAVDSAGAVHWVCPPYLQAGTNPEAAMLAASTPAATLPSAMELGAPSPGRMRFVAILSESIMHVLDVDRLAGAELSTDALQARWPAASVRDLATVDVAPAP
jgi:Putative zinc-finger